MSKEPRPFLTLDAAKGWVLIIGALLGPIVAMYGLYVEQTNYAHTVVQRNRVEQEVEIIKKQTNHALGEQKRIAWISANLLATQTKTPEHVAAAIEAERIYLEHVEQMKQADKVKVDGR